MKIGVCGYGVVGSATAEVFRRLGHDVRVADPDPDKSRSARDEGYRSLDEDTDVAVVFVCVPEANVRQAVAVAPASGITVIRSTVPPGTTERLAREFGRPLAHVPEFLREATALSDAMSPSFVLIGCDDAPSAEILRDLFAPLLAPVVIVSPSTSEMVKLTLNAYLHTLVSFWNEIHLICRKKGFESHVVARLCSLDPRVSSYGAAVHGKPVNGRCLPKDIQQLIAFAEACGYAPGVLKAVKRVNQNLAPHPDGKANGHVSEWPGLEEGQPQQLPAARIIEGRQ